MRRLPVTRRKCTHCATSAEEMLTDSAAQTAASEIPAELRLGVLDGLPDEPRHGVLDRVADAVSDGVQDSAVDTMPEGSARRTQRSSIEKKALISRCNRIEGQIRGIRGMIEEDVWCDDIIQQITAAGSALDALSRVMLERHMKSCLVSSIRSGDESVMEELLATIGKLMK